VRAYEQRPLNANPALHELRFDREHVVCLAARLTQIKLGANAINHKQQSDWVLFVIVVTITCC
jgi:hypothetical protein